MAGSGGPDGVRVRFMLVGETEDGDRVLLPISVCPSCGTPIPTTVVSMDQHARSLHKEDRRALDDY